MQHPLTQTQASAACHSTCSTLRQTCITGPQAYAYNNFAAGPGQELYTLEEAASSLADEALSLADAVDGGTSHAAEAEQEQPSHLPAPTDPAQHGQADIHLEMSGVQRQLSGGAAGQEGMGLEPAPSKMHLVQELLQARSTDGFVEPADCSSSSSVHDAQEGQQQLEPQRSSSGRLPCTTAAQPVRRLQQPAPPLAPTMDSAAAVAGAAEMLDTGSNARQPQRPEGHACSSSIALQPAQGPHSRLVVGPDRSSSSGSPDSPTASQQSACLAAAVPGEMAADSTQHQEAAFGGTIGALHLALELALRHSSRQSQDQPPMWLPAPSGAAVVPEQQQRYSTMLEALLQSLAGASESGTLMGPAEVLAALDGDKSAVPALQTGRQSQQVTADDRDYTMQAQAAAREPSVGHSEGQQWQPGDR